MEKKGYSIFSWFVLVVWTLVFGWGVLSQGYSSLMHYNFYSDIESGAIINYYGSYDLTDYDPGPVTFRLAGKPPTTFFFKNNHAAFIYFSDVDHGGTAFSDLINENVPRHYYYTDFAKEVSDMDVFLLWPFYSWPSDARCHMLVSVDEHGYNQEMAESVRRTCRDSLGFSILGCACCAMFSIIGFILICAGLRDYIELPSEKRKRLAKEKCKAERRAKYLEERERLRAEKQKKKH